MTHTLHRQGANLDKDYVVLAMAGKGVNEDGAGAKMKQLLRIFMRHNPVNMGDMKTGTMHLVDPEEIVERAGDTSIVHAVFEDLGAVAEVLGEIKNANLGISVVVTGLFQPVEGCCKEVGLARHTVEHSLGIWGRTEKLPSKGVLDVATMCGHGMVAFGLIKSMVEDVKEGRTSPEDAGRELAGQCVCGVFNPSRAAELLKSLAGSQQSANEL